MSVRWKESWKLFLAAFFAVGLLVLLVVVVVGNSNASSVKESINQTVQNVIKGEISARVISENKVTFLNEMKTRSLDDPDPVVQKWAFKKGDRPTYVYAIGGGQNLFFGKMCEEGQTITVTKSGLWTFPVYSDETGEFRGYCTTNVTCSRVVMNYPRITGQSDPKPLTPATQPLEEKVLECPK